MPEAPTRTTLPHFVARCDKLILLTGAASLVGGRLLKALQADGRHVRCLVRGSERPDCPSSPATGQSEFCEVVQGDFHDAASLDRAMQGVGTAFYLTHTTPDGPFQDNTCRTAAAFAAAARRAGIRRIVYLAGFYGGGKYSGQSCDPSKIGGILRESGALVAEFHPCLILGRGSLAFEIIRAIAERLSVVVMPSWGRTLTQAIAIEDVVAYLVAALDTDFGESATFEIGGPDTVSFSDLVHEYARQRGMKKLPIPLPLALPRLSILWLSLIAPRYARIGQELVASLCSRPHLENGPALRAFPIRPRGFREAIECALKETEEHKVCGAAPGSPADGPRSPSARKQETQFGLRIVDSRVLRVAGPRSAAFQPIERIGGSTGWYYANWLWRLRGLLDVLFGGVGSRRGRRDPQKLAVGDPVDFWRVEAIEPGELLRLAAEMKLPGRAWLQFELEEEDGACIIRQTAVFDPVGLPGLLYWYIFYPAHGLIFPGMLRGIGRAIPRSSA